jgi:hypothetical protein
MLQDVSAQPLLSSRLFSINLLGWVCHVGFAVFLKCMRFFGNVVVGSRHVSTFRFCEIEPLNAFGCRAMIMTVLVGVGRCRVDLTMGELRSYCSTYVLNHVTAPAESSAFDGAVFGRKRLYSEALWLVHDTSLYSSL